VEKETRWREGHDDRETYAVRRYLNVFVLVCSMKDGAEQLRM